MCINFSSKPVSFASPVFVGVCETQYFRTKLFWQVVGWPKTHTRDKRSYGKISSICSYKIYAQTPTPQHDEAMRKARECTWVQAIFLKAQSQRLAALLRVGLISRTPHFRRVGARGECHGDLCVCVRMWSAESFGIRRHRRCRAECRKARLMLKAFHASSLCACASV